MNNKQLLLLNSLSESFNEEYSGRRYIVFKKEFCTSLFNDHKLKLDDTKKGERLNIQDDSYRNLEKLIYDTKTKYMVYEDRSDSFRRTVKNASYFSSTLNSKITITPNGYIRFFKRGVGFRYLSLKNWDVLRLSSDVKRTLFSDGDKFSFINDLHIVKHFIANKDLRNIKTRKEFATFMSGKNISNKLIDKISLSGAALTGRLLDKPDITKLNQANIELRFRKFSNVEHEPIEVIQNVLCKYYEDSMGFVADETRDYIKFCVQIGEKPNLDIKSGKRMKVEHNKLYKLVVGRYMPEIRTNAVYHNVLEGSSLNYEMIDDKYRLIQESSDMGHCVQTYADYINDSRSSIWSIFYNNKRYTVEIGVNVCDEKFILSQIKGLYNENAPKDLVERIRSHLTTVKPIFKNPIKPIILEPNACDFFDDMEDIFPF